MLTMTCPQGIVDLPQVTGIRRIKETSHAAPYLRTSDGECERSLAVCFPNAKDMTKILFRSLRRLWSDVFKILVPSLRRLRRDMPKNRLLGGVAVGTKHQGMRSDTMEGNAVSISTVVVIYSSIIVWNTLTDSRGVHIQRKAAVGLEK